MRTARKGGGTGTARKDLEKKTGKKVVSKENYLEEPEIPTGMPVELCEWVRR